MNSKLGDKHKKEDKSLIKQLMIHKDLLAQMSV